LPGTPRGIDKKLCSISLRAELSMSDQSLAFRQQAARPGSLLSNAATPFKKVDSFLKEEADIEIQ
jgi:hypothetical protein